jgi:histidinol-phosphate aminotransferase
MDFVTPQIAVGSRVNAEDAAGLSECGIGALLSLAPVPRPAGIARQLSLQVKDREAFGADVIDDAVGFLKEQAGHGRRVLIHCEQGISRSPALAACYLHEAHGMDLDAAIEQVRISRPIAEPHPALLASMRAHYRASLPVDLSGNENPLGPSPLAIAAICRAAGQLHRYPDKDGTALRAQLARQLDLPAEQIVLGNGSCELIDVIARACLDPGSAALIPDPGFPAYRSAAARCGAQVISVPMPDGHYQVDEFLARLTPATRLVVVASPNNPTGTVFDGASLARLRVAMPDSAWLVVDEAYRDYARAEVLPDLLPSIRSGESIIVLRSLSKLHGLAGLRIGYGLAPAAMAARLVGLTQQYNTSSLAQIAAAAALGDHAHCERSLANNVRGLAELERGIAALGIEYVPSSANFVLLRAGDDAPAQFERRGVKVKCMARYGRPGWIRVSVGRAGDNARFLAVLAELHGLGENRRQSIYA